MSFAERDFLRRLIQDIAKMLAGIVGLRNAGKLDEAEEAIANAARALLGPLSRDVERLDSHSVAKLLGQDKRIQYYATLLLERAKIRTIQGAASAAQRDELRALELLLEAQDIGAAADQQLTEQVAELAAKLGPRALSARYRALLSAGRNSL